jgi:hypothetical protein
VLFAPTVFGAENSSSKTAPSAGSTKEETTKPKKSKPTAQKFRGQIIALDVKAGTLLVKNDTTEKSFITLDAAKDAIEQMTEGDSVRITYTEKEGKLVATSVRRLKVKNSTPAKKTPANKNSKSTTK